MRYIENDRAPVNFRSGRESAYGMHIARRAFLLPSPLSCLNMENQNLCIQVNEDVTTTYIRIKNPRGKGLHLSSECGVLID